jgi:plasmid stabilization system protein ParE
MEAAEELEAAATWYSNERPELLSKWRLAIKETLASIVETPTLWAPDRSGIRTVLVKRFPYKIIYGVRDEAIEIFAVAHTSRRPGYWRGRLKRRE